MRQHWHSSPTFIMRTKILGFFVTFIWGITHCCGWSMTKRTAGSLPTTPKCQMDCRPSQPHTQTGEAMNRLLFFVLLLLMASTVAQAEQKPKAQRGEGTELQNKKRRHRKAQNPPR